MKFTVNNPQDWQRVAQEILPQLKHNILYLKGDLGAGKTTFAKALLQKLGSTDEVSSPTYAIVNEYDSPHGKIYHFDLYRMRTIAETYDIGIEEYLDKGFLNIIEWPEVFESEILEPAHTLKIVHQRDYRTAEFH